MKHRKLWMTLLGVLFILLAVAFSIYPLASNYLAEKNKSLVCTAYTETVEELDDSNIQAMLAAVQEYNATLAPGTVSMDGSFSQDALLAAAEDYYDLLTVNEAGIMGYVEIPKIEVCLPIYHGTDEEVLSIGVGHLLGSTLPVGGESTHTVLTGHSGLATEKMFSDLDKLTLGDVFYLHVLDEVLAYEVTEINVVLPEDTSLLGIIKGVDCCTLITCTPFGVNTHRLLVRGNRTEYIPEEETAEDESMINEAEPVRSTWQEQYIKGLLIALVVVFASGVIIILVCHFKRPGKRGKHERR